MNDTLFKLKTNKEKLPFSLPGQVSYEDFADTRFQDCDSKVFIRPVLLIDSSIAAQSDGFPFPCRKDCCYLLYIKKGHGQLESDGDPVDLSTGSGFLTSADQTLFLKSKEGFLSFRLLLLTGDLLRELYNIKKEKIIFFTRYQYPDFEQRLNFLLNEYLNADIPLLFNFSRHMDHLLSRIIYQSMHTKNDDEKLKKQSLMQAITYMKEHCCEQMQVGDIATAFGYSSSHFSRIFQNEFHQSPKKYLLKLRIAHAEKLLTTSDLSIETIGQECGFGTTTHFIKTFREIHAMTPLQYRKQNYSVSLLSSVTNSG